VSSASEKLADLGLRLEAVHYFLQMLLLLHLVTAQCIQLLSPLTQLFLALLWNQLQVRKLRPANTQHYETLHTNFAEHCRMKLAKCSDKMLTISGHTIVEKIWFKLCVEKRSIVNAMKM